MPRDKNTAVPTEALRFEAEANVTKPGDDAGENVAREFEGVAYTGAPIRHPFYLGGRAIVDLESLNVPDTLPTLRGHDRDKIVGVADQISVGSQIDVSGTLSSATEHGREVAALSDEGFPWQMSIHVAPGSLEEVPPGESVEVNGQNFQGPGEVIRNGSVGEVSFTPTGRDDATSARALADNGDGTYSLSEPEDGSMEWKERAEQAEAKLASEEQARKDAEAKLSEEQTARQNAEAQLSEVQTKHRKDKVADLFQSLGREYSDDAAAPYLSMSDEAFEAVEKDLRASTSKKAPEGSLFEEEATGPGAGNGEGGDLQAGSDESVVNAMANT